MNQVSLLGNLTRDPAYFAQDDKTFTAKFDVATEVGYDTENKKQRVEFVPITAFGVSEAFKAHLKKGRKVSIVGRVSNDSYEKNGEKIYSTSVKVFNGNLRLIDSPKEAKLAVDVA
jgi:single-strand DNA-binding protein